MWKSTKHTLIPSTPQSLVENFDSSSITSNVPSRIPSSPMVPLTYPSSQTPPSPSHHEANPASSKFPGDEVPGNRAPAQGPETSGEINLFPQIQSPKAPNKLDSSDDRQNLPVLYQNPYFVPNLTHTFSTVPHSRHPNVGKKKENVPCYQFHLFLIQDMVESWMRTDELRLGREEVRHYGCYFI